MWDFINQIDTLILVTIHEWHGSFGNVLFPILREKIIWIPLYVFLFVFVILNFQRRGWFFILGFLFAVALSDTVSSKLIKFWVKRPRPCHLEELSGQLDMLISCGGPYGFTSSHATNHFAISLLVIITLGKRIPQIRWPVLIWAALISFAQIYVGVHYPLDILGGAVLGSLIGWGVGRYFNMRVGFNER